MPALFHALFTVGPFIPHGHCFLWKPGLVWLHVISDGLITLAYYSIPLILLYFLRQRRDLPFPWLFGLFSAFIFACGTSHLAGIWTLWYPTYWIEGLIKAVTAGVSVLTAVTLVPVMPVAIALPSPRQLAEANRALQAEVAERKQAEAHIHELNTVLEERVQQRTQELEQANQQLVQERDRYQSLVQATFQAVWVCDAGGQLQSLSGNWRVLTDKEFSELQGDRWLASVHPDDQARVKANWMKAIAAKHFYEADYRLASHQGGWRELRARGLPVLAPDGQVREWIGTLTDVTERNQLERELQQSEAKLNDVLNQADAAIVSLRLFANHAYQYLYQSAGCQRVFGYTSSEFLNNKNLWFSRVHPSDRAIIFGPVNQAIFAEQPFQAEYRFQHQDGSWRWISEGYTSRRDAATNAWIVTIVATDITHLKQTQIALRQSEERFRIIYEQAPLGIVLNDQASGHYLRANPQFCQLTGYTEAELLDCTWQTLTHPDDLAADIVQNARLMAGTERTYSMEKRYRGKDGTYRWVQVSVASVANSESNSENIPAYSLCVVEDIEQRRKAELAVRESEERLRQILQHMPVMLDAFDAQGHIVVWNRECEVVTGYAQADIVGDPQAMARLYPDRAYRDTMMALWKERGNNYRNWEWEVRCKDGSTKTIAWSNISDEFLVPGWAGWGVGMDVSDRKQAERQIRQLNAALEAQNRNLESLVAQQTAELRQRNLQLQATLQEQRKTEQALRHSEALFRQIFDNAPLGIVLAHPTTIEFIAINPAFCAMLGYNATELMALHYTDITVPEDLVMEQELVAQLLRQEIPAYRLCKRYQRRDRQLIWVEIMVRPIWSEAGNILYVLGLVDDISDRKRSESALAQRTTQLEATNRELESFSYSVSHDLRAPLRHVNGFVAALKRQLATTEAASDAKVQHYLEVLETSGQRMGVLIDGLLTLSRVGRRPMESRAIALKPLVEQAIQLVQSSYGDQPIIDFQVGDLPTVIGDAAMLQQVFTNLIDNAVKFSRTRPLPQIQIHTLEDETIFVKDNGVGFPIEYADQLFGAFQRLHSATEFEGTGIGLAIVQRIIYRHGGAIWADSQPEQGACFYFKLDTIVEKKDDGCE